MNAGKKSKKKKEKTRIERMPVGEYLVFGALLLAVCATAIAVVETAHESRELNSELAHLQRTADLERIEYDRLLLEQSAWSGHGRVTEIAEQELAMEAPDPFAIVIVQ